jgi:hypothetical protein
MTIPEIDIDQVEEFIERMEELVDRWRALEEPLYEIRREMSREENTA